MPRDAYPAEDQFPAFFIGLTSRSSQTGISGWVNAAAPCQIGLISWPYAFCLTSRDACQASNSIFAEKTSIQLWGKRPSFPRTVNSPRETRVAKTPQYNGGVNEHSPFSMPSQSLSGPFLTHQVPHCACPRDTCPAQEPLKPVIYSPA